MQHGCAAARLCQQLLLPGRLLQVVANYVAKTPQGKTFDSSLDKGKPYDIRVGAGQVCTEDGLGLTAVHWIQSLELACVLKAACAFQHSLAGAQHHLLQGAAHS